LADIKTALDQHATITLLKNFTLLKIDIEKLHEPSEQVKIAVWTAAALILVMVGCIIYCCCPTGVTDILFGLAKIFRTLFNWIAYGFRKITNALPLPGPTAPSGVEPHQVIWHEGDEITLQALPGETSFLGARLRDPPSRRSSNSSNRHGYMQITSATANPECNAPIYAVPHQHLYPDLPANSKRMSGVITPPQSNEIEDYEWKVEQPAPNRLLLRCRENGNNHTWVPHLYKAYSDFGISVNTAKPPDSLLKTLHDLYEAQPYITLQEYRDLYGDMWSYNSSLGTFVLPVDNKLIHRFGYKIDILRP
jgi:hypothetical protein